MWPTGWKRSSSPSCPPTPPPRGRRPRHTSSPRSAPWSEPTSALPPTDASMQAPATDGVSNERACELIIRHSAWANAADERQRGGCMSPSGSRDVTRACGRAGDAVRAVLDPLDDTTLFLEWWRITHRDRISRLHLDFNPASERYYDYTPMRWFAVPRDERRAVVAGPYVDLHGADAYVLTFGSPLVVDDAFVGIV